MILVAGFVAAFLAAQRIPAANGGKPEFYIVSSVNVSKSQILLKRPTEVTVLMQVNQKTRILNEQGKSMLLSNLRAGSTVWIVSAPDKSGGEPIAVSIREGPMTVQDLHRLYLDYPVIH